MFRLLKNNQLTLTDWLPFDPAQMTRRCDISGNLPLCVQDGPCSDPSSLRCLKYLATKTGTDGTDGCGASLPYSGGCTINLADVSALCELYAAAGGTGWTNKDGWETCVSGGTTATSDPCGTSPAWHGVTCDTTAQPSRVTRV